MVSGPAGTIGRYVPKRGGHHSKRDANGHLKSSIIHGLDELGDLDATPVFGSDVSISVAHDVQKTVIEGAMTRRKERLQRINKQSSSSVYAANVSRDKEDNNHRIGMVRRRIGCYIPSVPSPNTEPVSSTAGVFGSWEVWRNVKCCLFATEDTLPDKRLRGWCIPEYADKSCISPGPVSLSCGGHARIELGNTVRYTVDHAIREGLAGIGMWRCRSRSYTKQLKEATDSGNLRLPRYVDATAALLEAFLLDRMYQQQEDIGIQQECTEDKSEEICTSDTLSQQGYTCDQIPNRTITSTLVVASYGGAISRAVHTLTGGLIRSHSHDNEETSYRSRAQEIGLPEEAIELRRKVAHYEMPLLSELRFGVALTIAYLYETYWEAQEAQISELVALDDKKVREKEEEIVARQKKKEAEYIAHKKRRIETIEGRSDLIRNMESLLDDSSSDESSVSVDTDE